METLSTISSLTDKPNPSNGTDEQISSNENFFTLTYEDAPDVEPAFTEWIEAQTEINDQLLREIEQQQQQQQQQQLRKRRDAISSPSSSNSQNAASITIFHKDKKRASVKKKKTEQPDTESDTQFSSHSP